MKFIPKNRFIKNNQAEQQEFIEKLKIQGDPVVGDVKSTTIQVGGKDVAVNECTTQSGKKYYPDGSGNQVTPDVTTDIT